MQAGDRDDIGALQGSNVSDMSADAAHASEGLSNYLVCLCEHQIDSARSIPESAVQFGLVAVETSAGSILYDEFQ